MPRTKPVGQLEEPLTRQLGDPTRPGLIVSELPQSFCPIHVDGDPDAMDIHSFWFPNGLPTGNSVFLASSRLDQKLEHKSAWFDALRTFACRVDRKEKFLITADGVASDEFATRIAELFEIPLVRFKPFPKGQDKTWMRATAAKKQNEFIGYYLTGRPENPDKKETQSCKDRLLILAARQVRVLACRNSGITYKAVLERLGQGRDTRIVMSDNLTSRTTMDKIVEAGATAWLLIDNLAVAQRMSPGQLIVPILGLDEINPDQYLLHWTRRRVGKWPDQTKSEYLDDLIFGSTRAKHDPLAALCRILATDRIMASNNLTRDPAPVVCFSQVGLNQLTEMKQFRPHLSRWDFLPYGIAIEKEKLKALGMRKVVYGSHTDWNSLPPSDRPFFQLAQNESGTIDWRREKEWRLRGELDLRKIGSDQALVFVLTQKDAQSVAALSRWPVLVLSSTHE